LTSLRGRLVDIGAALLVDELTNGLGEPTAQAGEPTYATKITADELRIDWQRSAVEIDRLVRLGGAWTAFRSKRYKIHAASMVDAATETVSGPGALDGVVVRCGDGALQLVSVQPEGKPVMAATDWRNGAQPQSGERFE
jgi:methionyl-tRNA formyltransferase